MHHPTDRIPNTTSYTSRGAMNGTGIAQWDHYYESIRRPIAPRSYILLKPPNNAEFKHLTINIINRPRCVTKCNNNNSSSNNNKSIRTCSPFGARNYILTNQTIDLGGGDNKYVAEGHHWNEGCTRPLATIKKKTLKKLTMLGRILLHHST